VASKPHVGPYDRQATTNTSFHKLDCWKYARPCKNPETKFLSSRSKGVCIIEIDGSPGEGGGQVLSSSVTLALLTGQPVHLMNLRARKPKPGLQRQHLAAVRAAAAISGAEVQGMHLRGLGDLEGLIRSPPAPAAER